MRFVAIAGLMLAATPALADQAPGGAPAPAATPVAATTEVTPAKPKLICERQETTGTRLGAHKVCMTAEQWQQQKRDAADYVQRAQSSTFSSKGN